MSLKLQLIKRNTYTVLVGVVFLLTLITSLTAAAQNKPGYSLLWHISGKNLKQPSYLFGTMHVKDNRAFGFSDSVMLALQKCDAFALEVHPDTLMKAMFGTMDKDDGNKIRKLIGEEQYAELAKRYEQKHGQPMDEINPLIAESLMSREKKRADDKNTFVDAYLYGIATTLRKDVYGLEKAEDQLKTLNNDDEKLKNRIEDFLTDKDTTAQDEQMDKLTVLYNAGVLADIYDYLKESESFDSVLVSRNKVMLNSMLARMATKSMFTAVGVAHLPGPNGLINLFRGQGYTVTLVPSSFTGVSDQFKIDPSKSTWKTYTSAADGYSFEVPGQPIERSATQSGGLKTVLYPDMINELYYGAYTFPAAEAKGSAGNLELLKKIVDRYKTNEKNKVSDEKNVVVNGVPAINCLVKSPAGTMRIQFALQNSVLYCLYLGNNPNALYQPTAERFFNSLKLFKAAEKPAADWTEYKNSNGAFSVSMPGEPQVISKEVQNPSSKTSNPYMLNIYVAADTKNQMTYLVRYNDLPGGFHITDMDGTFENIIKSFKNSGAVYNKAVKITKGDFEGRSVKMSVSGINAEVQMFIRGNREYLLIRQSTIPNIKVLPADNFFNSFKFTGYEAPPTYIYKPADESFSIDLFTHPKTVNDSTKSKSYIQNAYTTYATNPASGAVYCIEYMKISPYYRLESVDSLYKSLIKELVTYRDTLIKLDSVAIGGIKGREFITRAKAGTDRKRQRLLIDGDRMIYLTGYMDSNEYFSTASDHFFNSYVSLKKPDIFDIAALKGEKILLGLESADTSVYNLAKDALIYYHFAKTELPIVYKALKATYKDDTVTNSIRYRLVQGLRKNHDEATLSELNVIYNAKNTPDELKNIVLSVMPRIDKKEGYNIYLDNLTTPPYIKAENNYALFSPLKDSLELISANYQRILPLVQHQPYRHHIIQMSYDLLNETTKPAYIQIVKNNYKALTKYAEEDLERYLTDTSANAYNLGIYYYLQLMAKVKGEAGTDAFTAKLLKKGYTEYQASDAVIARIVNNLPVPQAIINKLLDSLGTRYEIMKAYNMENKLSSVPLKYRTTAEFGRASIYNYVGENSEDEAYPDKISLLGTVVANGVSYYAYKTSYSTGDETKEFVCIYSPLKTGTTKLDFKNYNCFTNFSPKKINWQLQAQKLIVEWKKEKLREKKQLASLNVN